MPQREDGTGPTASFMVKHFNSLFPRTLSPLCRPGGQVFSGGECFPCTLKCCYSPALSDKLSAFQNGSSHPETAQAIRMSSCDHSLLLYNFFPQPPCPACRLPALRRCQSFTAGSQAPTIALGMLRAFCALILTEYILSLMKWRPRESALVILGYRVRLQYFEARAVDDSAVRDGTVLWKCVGDCLQLPRSLALSKWIFLLQNSFILFLEHALWNYKHGGTRESMWTFSNHCRHVMGAWERKPVRGVKCQRVEK